MYFPMKVAGGEGGTFVAAEENPLLPPLNASPERNREKLFHKELEVNHAAIIQKWIPTSSTSLNKPYCATVMIKQSFTFVNFVVNNIKLEGAYLTFCPWKEGT